MDVAPEVNVHARLIECGGLHAFDLGRDDDPRDEQDANGRQSFHEFHPFW